MVPTILRPAIVCATPVNTEDHRQTRARAERDDGAQGVEAEEGAGGPADKGLAAAAESKMRRIAPVLLAAGPPDASG